MPFFRGDDQVCDHRKFKRAGLEATGLYWLCVAYCSKYLTDGHVDLDYIAERVPSRAKREQILGELVDQTLFEPNGNGYVVHDFHDYNPTRTEVEKRRLQAAEKKRRQRMSPGDSGGDDYGDR